MLVPVRNERQLRCWTKQSRLRKDEILATRKNYPGQRIIVALEALPLHLKKQGLLGREGEIVEITSNDTCTLNIKRRNGKGCFPVEVYIGNVKVIRVLPPTMDKQRQQRNKSYAEGDSSAGLPMSRKTLKNCCDAIRNCFSAVVTNVRQFAAMASNVTSKCIT